MALRVSRMERLMARRLGLKRRSLDQQVHRVRRELPKPVRKDIMDLAQANHLSGNPRLARQIDRRAMARAERRVRGFLTGPTLKERRITQRLSWRAGLLFNLIGFFALVVGVLFWQGLI